MVEKEIKRSEVSPALTREARSAIRAMQAVRPSVVAQVPEKPEERREEKTAAVVRDVPDVLEGWERAALQARFGALKTREEAESSSPVADLKENETEGVTPNYIDGINLGRQEPYVTVESPSEDAEKVLRNIQRAWERSYIAHEGEHAGYRVVKEGQKEIFWGDFVHNKMQNLSGKEQEYIKDHLPQSNQPQDGESINERDNFSATEPRVVVGGGDVVTQTIARDDAKTTTVIEAGGNGQDEKTQLINRIAELKRLIQIEKNSMLRDQLEREKKSEA